ncbi:MAG TPA: DUF4258 domain-containing protein [Nitrospinota bacterium]|jgi:uncharacterized DUF497 family protein|nr:DUF4258 domain-containing protein [Nitrospinota bacterium]|tara:strand:+ start:5090 stop:5368 length:279 start_codon:yes stop_codon:yes gene_type:complete
MEFEFSEEKNYQLFQERGVTFNNVIESINEKGILLNIEHPNKEKYPNQKILVVDVDGYAYCVPYAIKRDKYFLKTIFPSRKFKYLIEGNRNE